MVAMYCILKTLGAAATSAAVVPSLVTNRVGFEQILDRHVCALSFFFSHEGKKKCFWSNQYQDIIFFKLLP